MLERDRHEELIGELRQAGARVNLIRDGDVAPAIAAARPETGVDLLYGIGGTPEGVISAAALKCVGGGIQGKLWPRNDEERQALVDAGYDLDRVLTTDDLVQGDDVFVAATGVTTGALLRGVRYVSDGAITDSIVMRSRSGTVRRIEARHKLGKARRSSQEGSTDERIGLDELGYDERLYILAFDHRGSFEKMVGDVERVPGAKTLIWEGFQRAVEDGRAEGARGRPRRRAVRRRRRARGEGRRLQARDAGREVGPERVRLRVRRRVRREDRGVRPGLLEGARPVQPRRRPGAERAPDREAAAPVGVAARAPPQVPVRAARAGRARPARERRRQRGPLRRRAAPAADDGGDPRSCRTAGVEPDIWKIEGIDDREACNEIAQLVRREGRDRVSCVVLGRGASDEKVDEWLRAGAGLDGYIGFAIGRSIFAESVKAYAADPDGFDRDAAVEEIARQLPPLHRRVRGRASRRSRIASTAREGRRTSVPRASLGRTLRRVESPCVRV